MFLTSVRSVLQMWSNLQRHSGRETTQANTKEPLIHARQRVESPCLLTQVIFSTLPVRETNGTFTFHLRKLGLTCWPMRKWDVKPVMVSIFIQQLSHSNWQKWIAHSGKIPVRLSENKLFSKANWAGDEGSQTFRWNNRFKKQGILQKTSTHPCQSRLPEASRLGMTTGKLETSLIPE